MTIENLMSIYINNPVVIIYEPNCYPSVYHGLLSYIPREYFSREIYMLRFSKGFLEIVLSYLDWDPMWEKWKDEI